MPIPRIPSRVKWYLSYGNQHSFVKGIKLAYIYLEPNTSSNTCIHDTTLKKSLGIFKGWFLKISPACQKWTMEWYSQRNQWPQLVRTNMVFRIDWRWRLSVSERLYALHQFHWGYTRLTSHGIYLKPLTQTILKLWFWKVYFHGGAFIFAGASIADGYFLLEHEVVLVSVDYRQGPFGFLSLNTSEVSGNQGLRDQQLALRWVSENIGQFGGDPDKVYYNA